jgi:hypothetical protein
MDLLSKNRELLQAELEAWGRRMEKLEKDKEITKEQVSIRVQRIAEIDIAISHLASASNKESE